MILECKEGEIPLSETRKCQSDGYTCHLNDGSSCCNARSPETRPCIPCDETMLKKPLGSIYSKAGTCDHKPGTIYFQGLAEDFIKHLHSVNLIIYSFIFHCCNHSCLCQTQFLSIQNAFLQSKQHVKTTQILDIKKW